jgi:hypothetical protein
MQLLEMPSNFFSSNSSKYEWRLSLEKEEL